MLMTRRSDKVDRLTEAVRWVMVRGGPVVGLLGWGVCREEEKGGGGVGAERGREH